MGWENCPEHSREGKKCFLNVKEEGPEERLEETTHSGWGGISREIISGISENQWKMGIFRFKNHTAPWLVR